MAGVVRSPLACELETEPLDFHLETLGCGTSPEFRRRAGLQMNIGKHGVAGDWVHH